MTTCAPSVQSGVTSEAPFPSTPSSYPSLLCPEAGARQTVTQTIRLPKTLKTSPGGPRVIRTPRNPDGVGGGVILVTLHCSL